MLGGVLLPLFLAGCPGPLPPPSPLPADQSRTIGGRTLRDPFVYLEDPADPRTKKYLAEENAHATSVFSSQRDLEFRLMQEFIERDDVLEESAPLVVEPYHYRARRERGLRLPSFVRALPGGSAETVLDLNQPFPSNVSLDLVMLRISPSQKRIAFAVRASPASASGLYLCDIGCSTPLQHATATTPGFEWIDDETFVYVSDEGAKRSLIRSAFSGKPGTPAVLATEEDTARSFRLFPASDGSTVLLDRSEGEHDEFFALSRAANALVPVPIPRAAIGRRYTVDMRAGEVFVAATENGRNFQLFRSPFSPQDRFAVRWHGAISRPHAPIAVTLLHGAVALFERTSSRDSVEIVFEKGDSHRLYFPEPEYELVPPVAPLSGDALYFKQRTLIGPERLYRYRPADRSVAQIWQESSPARFAGISADVITARTTTAEIPITIVRRVNAATPAPLVLSVYGAYGASERHTVLDEQRSLLDRGMTLAFAHVRGGGYLGEEWHRAGTGAKKSVSISDLLACARELIARGLTTAPQLGLYGRSAAGLVIGAALNRDPTLFGAAILDMPFLDLTRVMLDPSLPLTRREFREWGDPRDGAMFEAMQAISPYANLRGGAWPPTAVFASIADERVMYWESLKWIARRRMLGGSSWPLALMMSADGTHSSEGTQVDDRKKLARMYAFLIQALGVRE